MRFLSTRGKPWDIMLWAFYSSHGLTRLTAYSKQWLSVCTQR